MRQAARDGKLGDIDKQSSGYSGASNRFDIRGSGGRSETGPHAVPVFAQRGFNSDLQLDNRAAFEPTPLMGAYATPANL